MDINARSAQSILMIVALCGVAPIFAGQPGESAPVETPPLQLSSSPSSEEMRSPSPTTGKTVEMALGKVTEAFSNAAAQELIISNEEIEKAQIALGANPLHAKQIAKYARGENRKILLRHRSEDGAGLGLRFDEMDRPMVDREGNLVVGLDDNPYEPSGDKKIQILERIIKPQQPSFWKWENIKPYFITAGLVGVAAFLAYVANNKIAMMRAKQKHKLSKFPNRPSRILQLISAQV